MVTRAPPNGQRIDTLRVTPWPRFMADDTTTDRVLVVFIYINMALIMLFLYRKFMLGETDFDPYSGRGIYQYQYAPDL